MVWIKEVHSQMVTVEARNKKDAIKKVEEGDGKYGEIRYDYTLGSDVWVVNPLN
jgi:hypothetical protein